MANFGHRNLGPERSNSRDLSPQGPFSGDLSRSKKIPTGGRDFYGVSRRVATAARPFRPRAPPLQSMAAGGSPQPAAPIGAAADGRPATQKNRQHRKAGSAEKPEVPNGRPQTTGRRRRMAGRNRMTGRAGPRVTTESWPQQDDGPCRTAGRGRKAGRAGRLAAPDGWPRRMAGRGRATGSR